MTKKNLLATAMWMPHAKTTTRGAVLAGLCALSAFGITSTARAGPVPALGDIVSVTSEHETETTDTATITFVGLPGGSQTVYTSPELLSGTFGPNPAGTGTSFTDLLAYCTDLFHFSVAPALYTVALLTSSNQPGGPSDLTGTQQNQIANLISDPNHTDQAATQLAVWHVEYGDAFSFTGTSSTILTDYNSYVGNLNGNTPQDIVMYQLQSSTAQGFVIADPVAEPMSMTLLGMGLIGTGVVSRRRRRSPVTPSAC
jgi:hypothetical protein